MSSSEIEGKEHGQCIQWQDSAHSPETNSSGRDFLLKAPCGQSAAEARERGCRFGMLYFAWLPEQCYDEKIEEDFKNFKEWKFWLFQNRTGEITWDEAATGEYDRLYAEWEQHQRHCVDMFRRLHRVMASSSGLLSIDSHLSDWDHTEHCSRVLMERERSIHDLNSVRRLKYPDCGLLRW
ncbi:hypothetical protein BGW36DRAFT_349670 [Talaromyces proteolyticus]|uniref:Uncharacterized protein n=1 Tax=Talaromyces proteolyticus TaxID=1131652 RepID=A0AAD4KM29_9EURO|nr:uncharacterized protein BGW36DRAFT_349670 [Talaromyces proteolyticus]KAH8691587.1 hypothetical protein BGW36DRAFT_349670 [Talaromyces proteolyticus]